MSQTVIVTTQEQLAEIVGNAVRAVVPEIRKGRPETLRPEEIEREYPGVFTVRTLERWRQNGNGPAYSFVGNKVVYRRTDIEAFIAAGRVQTTGRAG